MEDLAAVELGEVQSPFVRDSVDIGSGKRSSTGANSVTSTTGNLTGVTTQILQRSVSHRHQTAKLNLGSMIGKYSTWILAVAFVITVLGEISYIVFVGSGWLETGVTFFIYGSFLFNFFENTAFSDEVVEGTAEFLIHNKQALVAYVVFLFILCLYTADYAFGLTSIIITLSCRFSMMFIVVIISVLQHKTLSYLKAFTYDCKFHKIDIFKMENGSYSESHFISDDDRRQMMQKLREKEHLFVRTRRFLRTSFFVNGLAFLGLIVLFILHVGGSIQDMKYTFFLLVSVLSTILLGMVQVVFYNKVLSDIRSDLNSKPLHLCSFFGWAPNHTFLVSAVGAVIFTLLKILVSYITEHPEIA